MKRLLSIAFMFLGLSFFSSIIVPGQALAAVSCIPVTGGTGSPYGYVNYCGGATASDGSAVLDTLQLFVTNDNAQGIPANEAGYILSNYSNNKGPGARFWVF